METMHSDYGDVFVYPDFGSVELTTSTGSGAVLKFVAISDVFPSAAHKDLIIIFLNKDRSPTAGVMSGYRGHFVGHIANFQRERDKARRDIDKMLIDIGISSECAPAMEYFCTLIAEIATVEHWNSTEIIVEMPESRCNNGVETMRYGELTAGNVREEACGICFEEFVEGAEVGRTNCTHAYHDKCLRQWLERKRSCPYCRAPVQTIYVWL